MLAARRSVSSWPSASPMLALKHFVGSQKCQGACGGGLHRLRARRRSPSRSPSRCSSAASCAAKCSSAASCAAGVHRGFLQRFRVRRGALQRLRARRGVRGGEESITVSLQRLRARQLQVPCGAPHPAGVPSAPCRSSIRSSWPQESRLLASRSPRLLASRWPRLLAPRLLASRSPRLQAARHPRRVHVELGIAEPTSYV